MKHHAHLLKYVYRMYLIIENGLWIFFWIILCLLGCSSVAVINSGSNSILSRPMQRKVVSLVSCQLVEEEGRARAARAARSLGERTVTELILQHQNAQQLSSNLWAAVRARGCQFLGPGMCLLPSMRDIFA